MTLPRWLPAALLFLVAAATGWLVWQLQRGEEPAPLLGPPRSDYMLIDFEMVALDEKGGESFRVNGPMLARHPHLGTLDVKEPRFRFPDSKGGLWDASAGRAWVSQKGDELRLTQAVQFDGPPDADGGRIALRTPELTVLPKTNEVRNESAVTVTGAGSILRGRGLRADLDARRFRLSQAKGNYAPPSSQ
jgi:lipopolysaccharide export system protein LptC